MQTQLNPNKAASVGNTTISGAGDVQTNSPTPNVLQSASPQGQNTDQAAVRSTMNGYGFDNDKISYDANSGYVTYNGQNFIKPSSVIDGTSYATEDDIRRGALDYLRNNGYSEVQQGLQDRSVGGTTITGTQYNIDGAAYADTGTLNGAARLAYKASGDELKAARDYIDGMGLGDIVNWNAESGTVNIGGTNIKPIFVEDGIAYIPKSQLDAAAEVYKQQQGMLTPEGVNQRYDEKYGDAVAGALARLNDRNEFNWNPDTDQVWQDHVDEQTRLADLAYQRAINSSNTPYGSTAAELADARIARDQYLLGLRDDEADYRNDAYDRYTGETERLRNNLSDTRTVANDSYSRDYTQDADVYNRSRQALQDSRTEDQRIRENQSRDYTDAYQQLMNEGYGYDNVTRAATASTAYDTANENLRGLRAENTGIEADNVYKEAVAAKADQIVTESLRAQAISNDSAEFEYKLRTASTVGRFTKDDESWLPQLSLFRVTDPITGEETGDYSIGPWEMELKYESEKQRALTDATNASNQAYGR